MELAQGEMEKQNQRTERLMELTEGEIEGKDLRIIEHPDHDHQLVLRESLQGHGDCYGGGRVQVYCDGCREPISSSSSSSTSGVGGGEGAFYACPRSDCRYLLHKRCAELPPKINHPSHPDHALNLYPHLLRNRGCDVCHSVVDGFLYCCSDCQFDVHIRCASMALRIQYRVDENKIHQHPLISLEKEAQFLCDACGSEHKGKSYLCPTCGFWADQICASAPTTISLRSHPHPLSLLHQPYPGVVYFFFSVDCEICKEVVKRAYWVYRCSNGCRYFVHVGCWLSLEKAEDSNKDMQTNPCSESASHKIEMPTWPVPDESAELMTQLIKKLSLQGMHKKATKILRCRKDHSLIFLDQKIDKSKDDQLCDGCAQTISSQFYHCTQCNFSLHGWCVELPNELRHKLHPEHPLRLYTQHEEKVHIGKDVLVMDTLCNSCHTSTNGFVYGCFNCGFYLDLKCASLPRVIKHQVHDHDLILRTEINKDPCHACGEYYWDFTNFRCDACNFWICIPCALLPFSVTRKYDKHPFTLTYFPIKGQPNDYYCEICEDDINSQFWFYHCIKCDQSLHVKCIDSIKRPVIMKSSGAIRRDSGLQMPLEEEMKRLFYPFTNINNSA